MSEPKTPPDQDFDFDWSPSSDVAGPLTFSAVALCSTEAVTVRGRTFHLHSVDLVVGRMLLALYALEDPRVDSILAAIGSIGDPAVAMYPAEPTASKEIDDSV